MAKVEMSGRRIPSPFLQFLLMIIAAGLSSCSSGSSSPQSPAATPASTKTSLVLSSSSVLVGNAVSLTATVTSSDTQVTTGSVTFYDGDTTLSTQALNSSGKAPWSATSLAIGTHHLTATYAGNASFASSSSTAQDLTITGLQSSIALSSSASASPQGLPVRFLASVTPPSATGAVTFLVGSTSLGSAQVDPTGTASFTSTALPAGTNSVTAVYNGDAAYASSQASPLSVTINASSVPTYTNPLTLNVSASQHGASCADPAIYKLQASGANTWYLYCTSDALYSGDPKPHFINIFHSSDLVNWTYDGDAFSGLPSWANVANAYLWAPAIKFFGGKFHLYYAASATSLAGNGSAIGVGTSASPAGPFVDAGAPVVEPQLATNCCSGAYRTTIDPDEIQDASGQRYILFGGFVGGLFVRKLSSDGLTSDKSSERQVAADNRYEGGNWWFHDGYYYLLASSTNCCNGPLSGYSAFAARAATPMGPYLDAQGIDMNALAPGGTPVLAMNGNGVLGPGGNVLFTDEAGQDYILYHGILSASPYYSGSAGYTARPAFIDAIDWQNGWPQARGGFGPSDSAAPQPMPAAQPSQPGAYTTLLASQDTPATQLPAFSDDFTTTQIATQWKWLHSAGSYTLSGNSLELPAVAADPVVNMAAVPLLAENAPPGDFLIETKIDLNLPATGAGADFAQAGLLLYGTDQDFLRLDLFSNNDTRQIEFIKSESPEHAGYPAWGSTHLGPPAIDSQVTVWLRIVQRNVDGEEHYTAYSSNDGVTWIQSGTWIHSLGPSPKICLYAGNRAGFTATFHYLHVFTMH